MDLLSVRGLGKQYPGFELKDVSFELREGTIMGFIGRNGAGKTTTLKSLIHFVHPAEGEILFFGKWFSEHEYEIKQRIGFVLGGINYYPKKRLRTITDVTKRFYDKWDDAAYRRYMELFGLDEAKRPDELSEGMKVKYALVLALSHHAEILLLDEPTSGLDPVSRDELLDIFLELVETEKVSILFSTHITTDLEKCADDLTYIKKGQIVASIEMETFLKQYRVAEFTSQAQDVDRDRLIGYKRIKNGFSALVKAEDLPIKDAQLREAGLEDIMVHMERE